ncbi:MULTISPECIES: RusA family crossover junction endodeoxyribonuclease [unclassified Methylobacterium]|uniref:RusA family crossover junction endodeoxyribonuclease n=1 Tax=Methylobacteriaceae TaxID=119045 RepID=UPI000B07FE1E|nr:hypothetical protein C0214_09500 [Methylobacterium sp. DM1]
MGIIHANKRSISFRLNDAPLSKQGKKQRREGLLKSTSEELNKIPFLFSDDVEITIELFLHEQNRYETDRSADIDNVVKPLLDVMTGPNGLMIDDNQVQSIRNFWVDTDESEHAIVTVSPLLEGTVQKGGLVFVNMWKQMYFPLNEKLPPKAVSLFLDALSGHIKTRNYLEQNGADYNTLRRMLPIQRLFHKTRITAFNVKSFDEMRNLFPTTKPDV